MTDSERIRRHVHLTNLVMDHMEKRSGRREAGDAWGGTLGTVLDRLQDAWTDAVNEADGDTTGPFRCATYPSEC